MLCRSMFLSGRVAALVLLLGVSQVMAASNYSETWSAGDTNGWVQNTTSSVVVRDGTDGNPAGSLVTRRDLSPPVFDIGATSELGALSGDYTGSPSWTFSFDAKYDLGKFADTWLRFRFQDSTFNGWHLDVADAFPNNSWQTNSVTFDSNWTNADASAHGWVDETAGGVSWQQLMTNVYHPEIRFVMSDSQSAVAHIDNVSLRAVPEPGSLSLLACGLGLLGFSVRRK